MLGMLLRLAATLAIVGALMVPRIASAQELDCGGVLEWFDGIDEIRLHLTEFEADASANGVPTDAAVYLAAARDADDLAVPDAASVSHEALVDGWTGIAGYLDTIVDQRTAMGEGVGLTFEDQESLAFAVSDARTQTLTGYLGWSALGAQCGARDTTDFAITADTDACASVADTMGRTAATFDAYWTYWEESYVMDRRRKSRYPGSEWLEENRDGTYSFNLPSNDWGEVVSPSELLSAFAYIHALELATSPVLPGALDLQQAAVVNFQEWSDLYLVNMVVAFGGLLGLDDAGFARLFELHAELSDQAIEGYEDLGRQWDNLSAECSADLALPALPGA